MGWDTFKRICRIANRVAFYGLVAYFLLPHCDLSRDRGQKHQRRPTAQVVEQREGDRYALLINGDADSHFRNDVHFAYESLIDAGFKDENVYVLESGWRLPDFVDGDATREQIVKTFWNLEDKIGPEDSFWLYVTNHGARMFWVKAAVLEDHDLMTVSELKELCGRINANYKIGVFPQCFSGNFASAFGKENTIGISASRKGKVSAYGPWKKKCGFDYHFFSAVSGKDPYGREVDADSNNDGRVSIEEIFDFTAQNNPFTTPSINPFRHKETHQLYWQNIEPSEVYIR